jgi:hypothetical protein
MQCTCRRATLWLLLGVSPLFAQTVANPPAAPDAMPANTPHQNSHKAQAQVVLPPMPNGPLNQVPMDQIPPTPAKVTFQDGLLEISAQNATLGEILRNVRKITGAVIDIPPGSNGANERVVTHLGPGAPRDVLAKLLNGSSFDYVMVGSSSDPAAVSSVILMLKPSASGETHTAANVLQNNGQPMPPNRFPVPQPFNPQAVNAQPATADANENKDDDQENAPEENADEQTQPEVTEPNTQVQQQQPQDPNQPNAGPRTPEQILEMLRRQQQPGSAVVPPPQQPPPQQDPQPEQ